MAGTARLRPRRRAVDGENGGAGRSNRPRSAAFLADNDSTEFFAKLGDMLMTGPTYTNVNDFRAIVVDRP